MKKCKECIHEKVCVIKAFPDAFENTQWDKEPCDHFKCADVVPKKEIANVLCDLKIAVHNKAHYNHAKEVPTYITIRELDAILTNFIQNRKDVQNGR